MGATGIGAPVRRKEDRRFITGKGHYTDDINRPGQATSISSALPTRMRRSNTSTLRQHAHPGVLRYSRCRSCG